MDNVLRRGLIVAYLKAASYIMVFLAGWTINGWRIEGNIAEAEAQRARDTIEIERLNGEKSEAVSKLHAVQQQKQKVKIKIVEKEVLKYVQSPNAGKCELSNDWVRTVNNSARMPSNTETASGANDTASGSRNDVDVLISVTDNYATCNTNAIQLKALQNWAAEVTK